MGRVFAGLGVRGWGSPNSPANSDNQRKRLALCLLVPPPPYVSVQLDQNNVKKKREDHGHRKFLALHVKKQDLRI